MKSKIALVIATSNDLHTFVMRASRVEVQEVLWEEGAPWKWTGDMSLLRTVTTPNGRAGGIIAWQPWPKRLPRLDN